VFDRVILLDSALLHFANTLADAARPIAAKYFRTPLDVDIKSDASPVTQADREIEAAIRALLETHRPDDGFFGEESGERKSKNGLTWVIDPIDGTKAFLCGKPQFGTLIALLENDLPILGVIDQSITGERWLGAHGHATTLNGAPVKTSAVTAIAKARLATTSPRLFSGNESAAFQRLSDACTITSYGGDCYNYALVATGTIDLVAETQLKLYDYAALIPVIEGAGGVVTGWDGKKPQDGSILAAATPALHEVALQILA
jgi:histidinol phosphatase-like enzyme (inositol monophosphatase family)